MAKSGIKISGFTGMNNIKASEGFFVKKGIAEPRIVLNADANDVGQIKKRDGKSLFLTLPGAFSLWACPLCMLVAASGKLYRIIQEEAVQIASIDGPEHPLSYTKADNKIYVSNKYWNGVFNPSDNSFSSWGITLPPGPTLIAASGNLPAGTYNVTFTNLSGNEISGNGPISTIKLTSEGGITIANRPSGAIVWASEYNEPVLYRCGPVDKIVSIPTIEPLPTFLCFPPPKMEIICYAFGRIWGSVDNDLYGSEPYKLGLFRKRFSFDSNITVIAKTPTGLWIGCEERTKFLLGTDPKQMKEIDGGAGSIKGTLAYCNNVPELGNLMVTQEKGYMDVPVWRTKEGIVVGNDIGRLFNLTKNKLKMSTPDSGASLFRLKDGAMQFLTSSTLGKDASAVGQMDSETLLAFKMAELIKSLKANLGEIDIAKMSDSISCQQWRDGELIP